MKKFRNRTQHQKGIGPIRPVGLICVVFFLSGLSAFAQKNLEVEELKAHLNYTRQQLATTDAQRKELMASLAEAVRVSEQQTFAAQEIQEKMEAFGVDLFTSSKDSLEQRLLKAVRDLDILQQEGERQRKALHELSEAFLKYIAATPDADEKSRGEALDAIEKAGKSLDALVNEDQAPVRRLENSQVVSVNEDWLIVLDAGRKSGVIVGTPIIVERDEQPLYTALIVDVRESISGAVLKDRVGNAANVKVGDKIRPFATETDL